MEYGIVCRPRQGNEACGDTYVVKEEDEWTLLAVIDGLGHGEKAAEAAVIAKDHIEHNAARSIDEIIEGCHRKLIKTRGAAIGIVKNCTGQNTLQYSGVGNVAVKVFSDPPVHPYSKAGIVGYNKAKPRVLSYHYDSLAAVLLYSDGVSSRLDPSSINLREAPQTAAEKIVEKYGKPLDDATLLIALYTAHIEALTSKNIEKADEEPDSLEIRSPFQVVEASRRAGELAAETGFSEVEASKISLAAAELARNIVIHAGAEGKIILSKLHWGGRMGVQIIAVDHGPGIKNLEEVLQGNGCASKGLGSGLAAVKRSMDEFRLEPVHPHGAKITVKKWLAR